MGSGFNHKSNAGRITISPTRAPTTAIPERKPKFIAGTKVDKVKIKKPAAKTKEVYTIGGPTTSIVFCRAMG